MNKLPNIVFIFCDDLGWGDVSCLNPESKIHTPHIDALAASGVTFTDAHAGSAVCTPSRYTLLTGRYCWRTRLKARVNGGYSPALITPERATVASELRRAGYRSACIGKWHIGMDWELKEDFRPPQMLSGKERELDFKIDFSKPVSNGPTDVGFDYFFGISASLDMSPYAFIENDRVTAIPTATIPRGTEELRAREGIGVEGWRHENVLPTLRDKAVGFIEENAGSSPFFLYLPVNGPHTPVVPNDEWIGSSDCGVYGDFVMEIDSVVGDVVSALERSGVADETIVFFSSDNGPETLTARYRVAYDHFSAWKWRGMKRDNWEGGHRIPLIVSWPRTIEAGAKSDRFVELADFYATALELAGVDAGPDSGEDSFSMVPLLLGGDASDYRQFSVHHSSNGKWAIRRGQWKLLLHSGSGGNPVACPENDDPVQLYDMEEDPFETTNVYRDHLQLVGELKSLCLRCITDGRSAPGPRAKNDDGGRWEQLEELLSLEVEA